MRPLLAFVEKTAAQRLHFGGRNGFVPGRQLRSEGLAVAADQQLADTAAQRTRVDGFGDVAVAACVDGLLLVAFHGESGQRDHRDIARAFILLDAARHLQPVDSGQLDVGQNQPRMVTLQQFQSLFAAGCGQHRVTLIHQQNSGELEINWCVVDDEYRLAGHSKHKCTVVYGGDKCYTKARTALSSGNVAENTLPRPGSLRTATVPPWASTMWRVRASPNPVP